MGRSRWNFETALLTLFSLWGALLMFAMEPLVGRLLLPRFGGGVHVWTTCLMFFQTLLLVGYCYARWVGPRIGRWHLAVILLPLFFLPIGFDETTELNQPLLSVLGSLLVHVAVPFGVLSTTGVMAQTWLARSTVAGRDDPYHLYAASNAGSLIGLLGYPFLIEPFLGLRAQGWIWTVSYLFYAVATLVIVHRMRDCFRDAPGSGEPAAEATNGERPSGKTQLYWFFLSAGPAILLMAITNAIAVQVGAVPMFWVLPLALYLLTFILAFARRSWIPRYKGLLILSLLALLPFLAVSSWRNLGLYLAAIFFLSLVSHTELHRRRPPPSHLTSFYIIMSLGGFAGGALVAVVAPLFFPSLYEVGIGIVLTILTPAIGRRAEIRIGLREQAIARWFRRCTHRSARLSAALGGAVLSALIVTMFFKTLLSISTTSGYFSFRNFYGIYSIQESSLGEASAAVAADGAPLNVRTLVHGNTVHGFELLGPDGGTTATGYYHADAPIGNVLSVLPSPKTVGVMGLGAGTMAAHFDRNDELVFYELDPDNERIAREHFRYLESCPANVRVAVGDGRLSLASDPLVDGHHYDALVIDAFSGDGIPIHLITVEAIETYLKTLKPNGLLAFHISNRYYDLRPILYAASRELGLSGRVRDSRGSAVRSRHERPSIVYVLATHDDALENLDPAEWLDPTRDLDLRDTRLWTDDYANMLVPLFAKLRSKFRVEATPDLDRENERVERDARLSPDRDHSGA